MEKKNLPKFTWSRAGYRRAGIVRGGGRSPTMNRPECVFLVVVWAGTRERDGAPTTDIKTKIRSDKNRTTDHRTHTKRATDTGDGTRLGTLLVVVRAVCTRDATLHARARVLWSRYYVVVNTCDRSPATGRRRRLRYPARRGRRCAYCYCTAGRRNLRGTGLASCRGRARRRQHGVRARWLKSHYRRDGRTHGTLGWPRVLPATAVPRRIGSFVE